MAKALNSSRVMSPSVPGGGGFGSTLKLGGGTAFAATRPTVAVADTSEASALAVKPQGSVGSRQDIEFGAWNPRASMAFDSAKGLLNPIGENNCFLNSAVQV